METKIIYLTEKISPIKFNWIVDEEDGELFCDNCKHITCNCDCDEINNNIRLANFWLKKARRMGIDHLGHDGVPFLRNGKRLKNANRKTTKKIIDNVFHLSGVVNYRFKKKNRN